MELKLKSLLELWKLPTLQYFLGVLEHTIAGTKAKNVDFEIDYI